MKPAMAQGEVSQPSPMLRRRYWLRTCLLTASLLAAWFTITFCSAYFADSLNRYEFLGFPLGFYLCAQGNLLSYLLIVGLYAKAMNRFDAHVSREPSGRTTTD